jgi:hypothetical protein
LRSIFCRKLGDLIFRRHAILDEVDRFEDVLGVLIQRPSVYHRRFPRKVSAPVVRNLDVAVTPKPIRFHLMGISRSGSPCTCYHAGMPTNTATGADTSRPAATDRDNDYTLSIEEVSERYARAGHPRTIRTLQRYSASGHLDAQKVATTLGDKYLVTPRSVARHIAQIEELRSLDTVATDRDQPRSVATSVAAQQRTEAPPGDPTTHDDRPRQATEEREVSRYVAQLEKRIEEKDQTITFLQDELVDRRTQIGGMKEIIDGQRLLLESINNNVAPVFTALAEVARGKPDARDVVRATIVGVGEKREVEDTHNPDHPTTSHNF